MQKKELKALESLKININAEKAELFDKYVRIFLEKNSYINLISKNDAKLLFEKHIFDSLAINLYFSGSKSQITAHNSPLTLLDIGTGGGFPSIPLAIYYDELNIYALDSIKKKIKVIEEIKSDLDLGNLHPICDRAENIVEKFDYVTTRAVAPLKVILEYAMPKLKKGGYFIAYKSKNTKDELDEAKNTIKKHKTELIEIINYTLPLEENFERKLLIFRV